MRNADILREIKERDLFGYMERKRNRERQLWHEWIKNPTSYDGCPKGAVDHSATFDLFRCLENDKYVLTENDIKILKGLNVLVPPSGIQDDGSFVAISDFHDHRYPLEKVKQYYINEYDKVYILGDATDRGEDGIGTGSIDLLLEIMELCKQYPDKIVYIPGNHDEFLLGYARELMGYDNSTGFDYYTSLMRNGGSQCVSDLNKLYNEDWEKFSELMSWLSFLPIQRLHEYEGREYGLAHALFYQDLYNSRPNLCLNDYFESQSRGLQKKVFDILWFRKGKRGFSYDKSELDGSGDLTMVIGHTIPESRPDDLDLVNNYGEKVKVFCVDGGIAYNGEMLKYDGGENTNETYIDFHNDTSPEGSSKISEREKNKIIYNDFILGRVLKKGKNGFKEVAAGAVPSELNSSICNDLVRTAFASQEFSDEVRLYSDIEKKRELYAKTFMFDYLIEKLYDRYSQYEVSEKACLHRTERMISAFVFGDGSLYEVGDDSIFTRDGHTRVIAGYLGVDSMKEVLVSHDCTSVKEYMSRKYGETTKANQYTKK